MEETLPTQIKKERTVAVRLLTGLAFGFAALALPAQAEDMVKFEITGGDEPAIEKSLTGKAGDPVNGRKVAINRKKGNCLACHTVTILKDVPYHGEVAPTLDGVAERYQPAQLRMMIVDQKKYFPDTIMPAMYRKADLHRVAKKFQGKTILTAQEVEDVLAFLLTLKDS